MLHAKFHLCLLVYKQGAEVVYCLLQYQESYWADQQSRCWKIFSPLNQDFTENSSQGIISIGLKAENTMNALY